MAVAEVVGDLLDQDVQAVVNPWNCNVFPAWFPSSGVSGALKRRTGPEPWRHLRAAGWLRPGAAVLTGAGDFDRFESIIHVAGLHWWWRASSASVRASIRSAIEVADREGLTSVATPLIGAGTGGLSAETSRRIILEELTESSGRVAGQTAWVVVARP